MKSRTDALIGRTIFEAKRDLAGDWEDVERKMPDDLANREGRGFPGMAVEKFCRTISLQRRGIRDMVLLFGGSNCVLTSRLGGGETMERFETPGGAT